MNTSLIICYSLILLFIVNSEYYSRLYLEQNFGRKIPLVSFLQFYTYLTIISSIIYLFYFGYKTSWYLPIGLLVICSLIGGIVSGLIINIAKGFESGFILIASFSFLGIVYVPVCFYFLLNLIR